MDGIAKTNAAWLSDHPDPSTSNVPYRLYNIGSNYPVKHPTTCN
jgi:UDP-glucuronate 4-epimerase